MYGNDQKKVVQSRQRNQQKVSWLVGLSNIHYLNREFKKGRIMIKNIIFDLGGVLVNLNRERCIESFRDLGADKVLDHITDFSHKGIFGELELGTITTHKFCEEIRGIVGKHIDDQKIIDAWNSFLVDFPLKRIHLLQQLSKRYRLFLLSNTNAMHVEKYEREVYDKSGTPANELFEKLFYSSDIQLSKPSPKIFEYVIREAGVHPNECVFIDDSAANIEAALQKGIHGIHIHPSEEVADLNFETIENNLKFVLAKKRAFNN